MSIEPEEEAKIRRAAELVDEMSMIQFVEVFSSIFDSFGDFAISVGNIEKRNPKFFEALEYLGKITPMLVQRLVETAPDEVVGLFMRIFVRMSTVLPQLSKLMELSPDEKVRVGTELKEFAKDFRELKDKMEEKE